MAPGWAVSQASKLAASRSGSRPITSPVRMSTSTVPYTWPLASAKSSTPSTSGAAVTSGSAAAAISRSTVAGCTAIPSVPASRAAARPASSSPNPASMPSSGTLRRRYRSLSPAACSAKVTAAQARFWQRNRRTAKTISTGRPPAAPSAITREYPPCTRADSCPHRGQHAPPARHDAEITTACPMSSTRCTRSPARCGNNAVSRLSPSSETSQARRGALAAPAGGMTD